MPSLDGRRDDATVDDNAGNGPDRSKEAEGTSDSDSRASYDNGSEQSQEGNRRKRVVVVGLGMVAVSFM